MKTDTCRTSRTDISKLLAGHTDGEKIDILCRESDLLEATKAAQDRNMAEQQRELPRLTVKAAKLEAGC
jgi:hypothetical protein